MLDSSSIDSILSLNQVVMFVGAILVVLLVVIVCIFLAGRKSLMVKFSEVDKNLKNYYNLKSANEKLLRQKAQLDADIQELQEKKDQELASQSLQTHMTKKLDELSQDYNTKHATLLTLEKEIAKSDALKEFVETQKAVNVSNLDQEIEARRAWLNNLQDKINETQAIIAMTELIRKLQNEHTESFLTDQLEELKERVAETQTELQTNQLNEAFNQVIAHIGESVNESLESVGTSLSEINSLQEHKEYLKQQNAELTEQHQKLQKEVNKLLGLLPQNQEEKEVLAYQELTNPPRPILQFMQTFRPNDLLVGEKTETEILEIFRRFMNARGLYYSLRTITAFHTSLKVQNVNPISVLAGVSGTGKTQLAINYAKFFGMYCEHVAVQPRWDSKDDLLGFYNFLEQRYQPTKLAASLYWFDQNLMNRQESSNSKAHPMMLVILDEMNLARVEYYFSEFLSKLELRNSSRSTKYNSEDQSSIFLGPQNSGHKMNVSFRNVLFVGTMNEDESTFSLSDKVLDRSNVLHFAPPSQFGQNTQEQELIQPISITAESFATWCPDTSDFSGYQTISLEQQRQVNNYLNEINAQLEKIGKGFGHRVNRSINEYVRLYPGIKDNPELLKQAFADQLEMKIIPKLSGIEMTEQSEACLTSISRILEELNDAPLSSSFSTAMQNFRSNNMFIWHGVKRDSADS